MNIGEPQRIHTITPTKEPVPQWQPEKEPWAVPQEEPVFAEPILEPAKVEP
jgi:hypothetical protein